MHGIRPEFRDMLMQLAPAMLTRLETEFERNDPRRTGLVTLESFQNAVSQARIPATPEAAGKIYFTLLCIALGKACA